jgi:hypothetical protein
MKTVLSLLGSVSSGVSPALSRAVGFDTEFLHHMNTILASSDITIHAVEWSTRYRG